MLRDPSYDPDPSALPAGDAPRDARLDVHGDAPLDLHRDAPLPPSAPPGREATILVVDDIADVRYVTRLALEMAGYRVIDACGGQEALEILAQVEARRGHIDLVLTDVMMPGMDGPALASRVRASRPAIPILFVSANRTFQPPSGPQGPLGRFLPKPYRPSEVVATVAECLAAGVGPAALTP